MANHPDMIFSSLNWDCSDESIKNPDYTDYNWSNQGKLDLWENSFSEVYNLIYKPEKVYAAKYLWSNKHDKDKIARVIDVWNNGDVISPVVFLVNDYDLLDIVSGNHRFSVARAFYEKTGTDFQIPFLINEKHKDWVKRKLPNAKFIRTIKV